MTIDKPKKKVKRSAEAIGNVCPYCVGWRDFSSREHLNSHIALSHPEKRKSLI